MIEVLIEVRQKFRDKFEIIWLEKLLTRVKYPIVNSFTLLSYFVQESSMSFLTLIFNLSKWRCVPARNSSRECTRARVWAMNRSGRRIGDDRERERRKRKRRCAILFSDLSWARWIYKWVITVWKGNKGGWHTAVDVKSRGQGYGRGQGNSNKYILTWESLADGLMHNNCNGRLSRTYTVQHDTQRTHAGKMSSLLGPLCCRIMALASSRQIL